MLRATTNSKFSRVFKIAGVVPCNADMSKPATKLYSIHQKSMSTVRIYRFLGVAFWSRVVSVLDSGAEGPGFKTVHTHRASVHQAAKLVAALSRVAGVTAGLAESNGSLPPGLWFTSPAGWLPRTGINSGTLRSVIEYGLPLPFQPVEATRSSNFAYDPTRWLGTGSVLSAGSATAICVSFNYWHKFSYTS